MKTFINEVIQDLLNTSQPLLNTVIVLPSKRAGTFFIKSLRKHLEGQTTFLPKTISIEELIEAISGLTTASQTQLQVELYDTYTRQFKGADPDTFLNFLGWGQTLIGDFNEIDRHLIPTDSFFDYLSAVKELNHWSTDKNSVLISNYLLFWNSIQSYYTHFKDSLTKQGLGYQGMLYRNSVEKIEDYLKDDNQEYIFCGFNALNLAEQKLIRQFLKRDSTRIYWDIDPYFLEDKNHVTNRFISSYLKNWPELKAKSFVLPSGASNFNTQKTITATGIAQNIGQVKYVGQLLANYSAEELTNTAVVLGDEGLLLPLLNSLPPNVTAINVTMGLTLNQVAQATFFENWFQLQINSRESQYYYKDVLSFLDQQYTVLLLGSLRKQLKDEITKNNLVYLNPLDLIEDSETKIVQLLFKSWNDSSENALNCILKTINQLKELLLKQNNWLELEFLHAFLQLFNQLANLSNSYPYFNNLKTLRQFYRDLLSKETLDFRGDPYQGLQIMGVLESRVIDFKHVIITSLNEGTFPSGKSQNSFIPFDLKVEYKLPTYREKDAIYAYHFFRLLQRAETVDLIYNNEAGGLNNGEKSRFLLQLATDPDARYTFTEVTASAPVEIKPAKLKKITKTPDMIASIRRHANSGFSPSALTTYIRNPVDFYYNYVLNIKELEEVEDTIAHKTLGTVVHETLETLYKPYLGELLSTKILDVLLKSSDKEVRRQFGIFYNSVNIETGKNLIIFNVAKQFVRNFLNAERALLEKGDAIRIVGLELGYSTEIRPQIKLKGTVDRIDVVNGTMRILDYKTGKVESHQLNIKDWDELITDYKKQSKAFQVLCYALMIAKEKGLSKETEAGIISFKNLNQGFLKLTENRNSTITPELLKQFEMYLNKLIDEILDLNTPFIEKEV